MSQGTWLVVAGLSVSLSLALPRGSGEASGAAPDASLLGVRATDLDGNVHCLGTDPSPRPVAVVFVETTCPIAKRYAPRLTELAAEASEAGVGFFGILSDPTVSLAEARKYQKEYELGFPILFDVAGDLAARLKPERVPEAFVIARDDTAVYRGRIDDRFVEVGKLRQEITSHDLLDAIRAVAEGDAPREARTESVGCVFEAWKEPVTSEDVTYTRHVAPILNANCIDCHRTGDIGPFPLTSFKDAKRRAAMIAEVVEQHIMPPWRAEPDYGHFRAERVLSKRQIAVLSAWADAGAPKGDPAELVPPPPRPDTRWRLGDPDYVVSMPVEYDVPAAGDDVYRYFVIPSEYAEDMPIVGVDFRPGDPSVVHHCLAYLDTNGDAKRIDASSEAPGFSLLGKDADYRGPDPAFLRGAPIAGWAPGNQPYKFANGLGYRLPGGVDFVLEVHYHPTGKATTDRSELAFYFADEPIEHYVQNLVIGTERVDIPPGDDAYGRYVYMELPTDVELIDVTPHMHFLGRNVEAFATLPDGTTKPLIRIANWDFRWQDTYTYREPVQLPKGTLIEAIFQYDNSAANPFNPSSPPIRVKEGWQTTDEMCLFYFNVVPKEPGDHRGLQRASMQSFGRPADF